MIAALTLLSLLVVSLTVVRIGGTALRLTGMSQQAARFQSVSALTGTGYTTSEAETAMHHPLRRRILVMLMVTGHLGVVSVVSTVILGLSTAEEGSLMRTVVLMAAASVAILALARSHRLDRLMCAALERFLRNLGWFEKPPYLILAELPGGDQLAEHEINGNCHLTLADMAATGGGIHLLKLDGQPVPASSTVLKPGQRLLCYARAADHALLSLRT